MNTLLNIYLKLEENLNMEYMIPDKILLTYYENDTLLQEDLFIFDQEELTEFFNSYQLNPDSFTQPFILLEDTHADFYKVWTASNSYDEIFSFFKSHSTYSKFIHRLN